MNNNLSLREKLENTYEIQDSSLETLTKLGFRYYRKMNNDNESLYYIYSFPIEKHNNSTVMICDIIVEVDTGLFSIDIRNNYDDKIFVPFYNVDFINGYEQLLNRYEEKILKKFKQLKIEHREKE